MDITSGVLGLLGSNGAGKSTLMKIIASIIKPDSGEVILNGSNVIKNPQKMRNILGYLPQNFGIYQNLNAVEFLQYIGSLKGIDTVKCKRRIYELLQLVNLYEVCKRPLGSYSGGMKQRIGIAQALLNDPQILILDEPTVGLDPEERINFRNMVANLSKGRIIILSTHIVSDLESIATKIAILKKGSLINYSSPEKLLMDMKGKVWECTMSSEDYNKVKDELLVSDFFHSTDGIHIRVISNNRPKGNSIQVIPKLEDAYLYYNANDIEE
jgi:ABC-type multidrug transport system ATPase subunit